MRKIAIVIITIALMIFGYFQFFNSSNTGITVGSYDAEGNYKPLTEVVTMKVRHKQSLINEVSHRKEYIVKFKQYTHYGFWYTDWYCHTINPTLWELYSWQDEETFVMEDGIPTRVDFECFATKHELSSYLREYPAEHDH